MSVRAVASLQVNASIVSAGSGLPMKRETAACPASLARRISRAMAIPAGDPAASACARRSEGKSPFGPGAVVINGVPHTAVVKEFSTGSLGWNINAKTEVSINGKPVKVQIGLNLTIVVSKEFPEGQEQQQNAAAAA